MLPEPNTTLHVRLTWRIYVARIPHTTAREVDLKDQCCQNTTHHCAWGCPNGSMLPEPRTTLYVRLSWRISAGRTPHNTAREVFLKDLCCQNPTQHCSCPEVLHVGLFGTQHARLSWRIYGTRTHISPSMGCSKCAKILKRTSPTNDILTQFYERRENEAQWKLLHFRWIILTRIYVMKSTLIHFWCCNKKSSFT